MSQWPESLTEALLYESTEDLYEHAPCGYVSLVPNGTIGKINTTLLDWTGFGREELVGRKRFVDLMSGGGRIFYETHFLPLLSMQGQVREIAFDLVCRNGGLLPVLVNATQKVHPDVGPVTRIIVFDATDRRRYERELVSERKRAQAEARAKADLVTTLSHDVRAPLSAIITAGTLLERSDLTPLQARYLRVLRSSAAQALALVSNLLDLGRLDAGRLTLRESAFSMRTLVNDVVEVAIAAALAKPGVEVRTAVDHRLPELVAGDRARIGQVLSNLLMNAVKFTDRGHVSLEVRVDDVGIDHVTMQVVVSDTGIGIPEDRLSRIFEEYGQASDEIEGQYGGSGLGLAICRRILGLYATDMGVSSIVGEGTIFSFPLTLKRA